jgi:hypothetical protein
MNTLQIQLYPDGRIIFAYQVQAISALSTGTIVGLTPGPNSPSQALDYSTQTDFSVPANNTVFEYFTAASPFDLDGKIIIVTPGAGGTYTVRTITSQPSSPANSVLTGAPRPAGTAPNTPPVSLADIAKAEILVRSSVRPKWVGMTNADAQGNFVLTGVPQGGITVQVRKKGKILAQGAGVFSGGGFGAPQVLQILYSAAPANKTSPRQ